MKFLADGANALLSQLNDPIGRRSPTQTEKCKATIVDSKAPYGLYGVVIVKTSKRRKRKNKRCQFKVSWNRPSATLFAPAARFSGCGTLKLRRPIENRDWDFSWFSSLMLRFLFVHIRFSEKPEEIVLYSVCSPAVYYWYSHKDRFQRYRIHTFKSRRSLNKWLMYVLFYPALITARAYNSTGPTNTWKVSSSTRPIVRGAILVPRHVEVGRCS